MATNQGPGLGGRFEEIWERLEEDLRAAADYVNDNVVPVVRKESITAMRKAADVLKNLADRIEKS